MSILTMTTTATTANTTTTTTDASDSIVAHSAPITAYTKTTALPRTLRKKASLSRIAGAQKINHHNNNNNHNSRLSSSASTPNLGAAFALHAAARLGPPPPLPTGPLPTLPSSRPSSAFGRALNHKASLAALTQTSLATIPDASESYAFDTLNELASPPAHGQSAAMPPAPLTPGGGGRFAASLGPGGAADDVAVGDTVDVPGGMVGTVRFVGSVAGRKGVFAGVELNPEYAARGKNNGDVDGVSYFNTSVSGAGIFLPITKAARREGGFSPLTPTASTAGLKLGNQNSTNFTPPTPALPKFSQSVNGGYPLRASSPQGRRGTAAPRTSLPRPDSPTRRVPMTPAPSRPSMSMATPKPAAGGPPGPGGPGPGRFGSPTSNKFSQSMRAPMAGGAGDPSKRGLALRKGSIGPRSASALGGPFGHFTDDESSSSAPPPMPTPARSKVANNSKGSAGSASSLYGQKMRPPSRTASRQASYAPAAASAAATAAAASAAAASEEELQRLRAELDDRERQLKDQASTLADMESSLTELQTLMESPDGPMGMGGGGGGSNYGSGAGGGSNYGGGGGGSLGGDEAEKDVTALRALLREKNEKIAMLTAEFDAHRADFRSTIDTLELASTETERVYEKKIEELMQEIHELETRTTDFDSFVQQMKQMEECVQDLEEGLDDARRAEVEARGEVEFLRGEVERVRAELRRERERGAGAGAGAGLVSTKELEQKDDEIRGLKAIIHSLSQNAGSSTGGGDKKANGDNHDAAAAALSGSSPESPEAERRRQDESILSERMAREKLEREVAELRALLDAKTGREVERERELARVSVNGSATTAAGNRSSAMTIGSSTNRSSLRDSRSTVVLARDFEGGKGNGGHRHTRTISSSDSIPAGKPHHSRGPTLDTMPESDAYSSVTEASTLWCEICETNGHDILTCTNMFGPAAATAATATPVMPKLAINGEDARTGRDVVRAAGLQALEPMVADAVPRPLSPLPLSSARAVSGTHSSNGAALAPAAAHQVLPNPMESGPVAGKESGVVDSAKWCALCERDGHDSVDCPFEDAF